MPEPTYAADAIALAQQHLAERGIDIADAKLAFKSQHPRVDSDQIDIGIYLEVASFMQSDPPYTVESIAEQMANRAGAFPWHGPVGNGLSLEYYQGKFRDMARDQLFLAQQLGLCTSEGGHA